MNTNENLIHQFYTAFQDRDVATMQQCYADTAVFEDPVFGRLEAKKARMMWAMLIRSSKDMRIEYAAVQADESTGRAEWVAYYTFSATGAKVVNRVKATFVFEQGKIVFHQDQFDFYTWAKQAMGWKGWLLGRTTFFKTKVSERAANNLQLYMDKL